MTTKKKAPWAEKIPSKAHITGARVSKTAKGILVLDFNPDLIEKGRCYIESIRVLSDGKHLTVTTITGAKVTKCKQSGKHILFIAEESKGGKWARRVEFPLSEVQDIGDGSALALKPFAKIDISEHEVYQTSANVYTMRIPLWKLEEGRTHKPFTRNKPQEMETEDMTTPQTAQTASIVSVEFAGSPCKRYSYYTYLDLEPGDLAIVVSPFDGRHSTKGIHYREDVEGHAAIVKVLSTEETVEGIENATKWIDQKVDLSAAAERTARTKKRQLIEARIKRAASAARANVEMEKLCALSPELKALIEELNTLG